MIDYKPGDVVNGHVLTSDGRWIPLTPPPPAVPQVVVVQNVSATFSAPTVAAVGAARSGLSTGEHVLHAILTLSTFGLWGIVWVLRAISARGPKTSIVAFPSQPQSQQPQWQPQQVPQQPPWPQQPHWYPQQVSQQQPRHQAQPFQSWQSPPPAPPADPEQTQVLPDARPGEGPQDSTVWPSQP